MAAHLAAIRSGETNFQPLAGLLGNSSPHRDLPASWIARRGLLVSRKWSPASMAALHVGREAVAEAMQKLCARGQELIAELDRRRAAVAEPELHPVR